MERETKYDIIVNFLLDYWIVAIIVFLAVFIAFIPSIREGLIQVYKLFSSIFQKKKKDFVIKHEGETITFEYKIKSTLFDIVKINAITHSLGVSAEYKWTNKYYPNYKTTQQSLSIIEVDEDTSLHFDTLKIESDKGKIKMIYFDISSFFNKDGHSSFRLDDFAKSKIKEIYKKKNHV